MRRLRFVPCLIVMAGFLAGANALPGADESATNSFADLSLEELMNVSVTSVSKKKTMLADSPAAISVLTSEDIRRMGATSIPEALRAVPGVNVARINANEWAVSARGFNSQYARQLLVLVDGRSVYTPSFSGVFWHTQDLMMEDIDRIEVIRGPGATLWGANAVNGVINIMTKSAKETQGFLGNVAYGTDLQPLISLRYGGQLATNLHYRVYGQYLNHDSYQLSNGRDAHDEWWSGRSGLRLDWEPTPQNQITVQGDYNRQAVHQLFEEVQLTDPVGNQVQHEENINYGGNVLGRWTHTFDIDSESSLQFYYDTFKHKNAGTVERRDTFDVDWQHRFGLGTQQEVLWGLGYRYTPDDIQSDNLVATWESRRSYRQYFNAFVQDEIDIVQEHLSLTLGSKFEHNDYTGVEIQPSGRLLWTPTEKQTAWAAVSRATRTPSRFEDGGRINLSSFQPPASPPILLSLFPAEELESEKLIAYEAGYRIEPVNRLSLDLAVFYNRYEDLSTYVTGANQFETTPPPGHVLIPLENRFDQSGETHGAEFQAQWQATDAWRLMAGYTWLQMNVEDAIDSDSPAHQFNIRSHLDITPDLELNGAIYFVDSTSHPSAATPVDTPGYLRFDLGLTWRPTTSLELAVWGQNLLESRHSEFFSFHTSAVAEVPRAVYGKLTWKF